MINTKRLISGIFVAVFSVLISDMHTITDILVYVSNSYQHMQYPLYISGYIAGPITAIALLLFNYDLFKNSKDNRNGLIKSLKIIIILYALSHFILSIADINYANVINNASYINSMESLINAGIIRGISTLLTGICGMVMLTLFIFLFREKDTVGLYSSIISLICVILGITVKSLSLVYAPIQLMVLFIILMLIKGVSFIMVCTRLDKIDA